ncbi:MAG: polysaccharide biosynthesis tyrosine autokinase [Acidobacteriota bacterium]|nr:polysaccharide biosynthesis tyrosine autokinase [Acidobacteriota bacterium]
MTDSNGTPPSTSPPPGHDPGDRFNLREYWRVVSERRGVLLTSVAVTVATVMLVTFLSTPQYVATTSVQIERQGPDVLTFKDIVGMDPAFAAYDDFYQTQYKILQSRAVLRLATEGLDLGNRPEIVARKGSPLGRLRGWAGNLISGSDDDGERHEPGVEFIQGGLTVQPVRNSHLVRISFMDRDPVVARDIADAVADAYQRFNLESRYGTTDEAAKFLAKEVARIQSEIADLEMELLEKSSQKEILGLSDGTRDVSEQALADLITRLTVAKGRRSLTEARWEAVSDDPPESLPEVFDSPVITGLKQEHGELERRYSQMKERFKPGWPELGRLEEELAQARRQIELETTNIANQVYAVALAEYEQSQREVESLQRQVNEQKNEVKRVNHDAIAIAGLTAEIGTRRSVLEELVARQSQTQSSGQLRETLTSNIRVVDRAEIPESPARPRKLANLMVSLLLGLAVGVGMAFLFDHLDNTVKNEQDVERYSGGTAVLGHIPLFQPLRVIPGGVSPAGSTTEPNAGMASHNDPRSSFSEAFRHLRTSLLLASPDHPPRSIVVTSCEPGDGKSTVSLNTAIVLTQMGRRVLLVDADLRRPRLHKMLDLDNDTGLSSLLSGNATLSRLIQDTAVPNLHAITSGPIPPNPSELLGSAGLDGLLASLDDADRFDHVLFDSPPALQVADGIILSARVEATILVVRVGSTRREALQQGTTRLKQGRARILGVTLNAMPERTAYYYYRKYRYYDRQEDTGAGSRRARRRRRLRQA